MKNQLWILNGALLIMFFGFVLSNFLLRQSPPRTLRRKPVKVSEEIEVEPLPVEQIYGRRDLFGMFTEPSMSPQKNSFATPVPVFRPPAQEAMPEIKPPDLIEPLAVSLNGIIVSSDEEKSVAMILDDSGKEKAFHVGEQIKDSTIVKISNDRIVLLRNNGQQERVFLRQENIGLGVDAEESDLSKVVKKLEDNRFQVDPFKFAGKVGSLGDFIEELSVGPGFKAGEITGARIGKLEEGSIGKAMGLNEKDLITSILNFNIADPEKRLEAYKSIKKSAFSGNVFEIPVTMKRAGKEHKIIYVVDRIRSDEMMLGITEVAAKKSAKDAGLIPPEHNLFEKKKKSFDARHERESYDEMIDTIRQRLIDNMHSRKHSFRER